MAWVWVTVALLFLPARQIDCTMKWNSIKRQRSEPANRGRKQRPGAGERPRQPNAAYEAVWSRWKPFSSCDADPTGLLTDPEILLEQQRILRARREKLSTSCVWLSLMAQCDRHSRLDLLRRLGAAEWSDVTGLDSLRSTLHYWGKEAGVRIALYDCSYADPDSTDSLLHFRLSETWIPGSDSAQHTWTFMRVRSGERMFHLLPLAKPSRADEVRCVAPPGTERTRQEKECAGPVPAGTTPPTPSIETTGVVVEGDCSPRDGDYVFVPAPPVVRHSSYSREKALVYEGPIPPSREGWDWVAGWWGAAAKGRRAKKSRGVPDIASATLRLAGTYRTHCLYQAPPQGWRQIVLGRGLDDGVHHERFFVAGDTLTIAGEEYYAEETVHQGLTLLRLRRSGEVGLMGTAVESMTDWLSMKYRIISRCLGGKADPAERLLYQCPGSSPELTRQLEWAAAMKRAPDCVQGMMSIGRSKAAACQWGEDAPRAHEVESTIHRLEAQYENSSWGYRGGSSYGWGYCYSCGSDLPGNRMEGRLCGCPQTTCARAVARGEHVVGVGRVVYPGVVLTESQHPPLKSGKETTATERCFRAAP